jgi:hypothetical protein
VTDVLLTLQGRPLEVAVRECLEALPEQGRGRSLRMLLSSALAQPFLFGPMQGLRGRQETQAVARVTARSACSIEGDCEVALEGDPRAGAVLATAVTTAAIDGIYLVAKQMGVKIKSVRPVWAVAIERAASEKHQTPVLCCRDPDGLVLLADSGSHWLHASVHEPAPTSDGELQGLLRRALLSLDVGTEGCLLAEGTPPAVGAGAHFNFRTARLAAQP